MKCTTEHIETLLGLFRSEDIESLQQGIELAEAVLETETDRAIFLEHFAGRAVSSPMDYDTLKSFCDEYPHSIYLALWLSVGFGVSIGDRELSNALMDCYDSSKQIPSSIIPLVTVINFDEQELGEYPDWISTLENLTTLKLGYMHGESLPESLGGLTKLRTLKLLGSRIVSLPESIGKLRHLKSLDLWVNWLSSLPDGICDLSQLEYLQLESNELTSLPDDIGNMSNLQYLHLCGNQLTSLPDSIQHLRWLSFLDLSHNPISEAEKKRIQGLLPRCEIIFS